MANPFLALPRELIETVVLELHETSRNSIFDLLRTNKLLHEIVLPYTVRRCFLDFSEDGFRETDARLAEWLAHGGRVCKHAHHIVIHAPRLVDNLNLRSYSSMDWVDWDNLVRLLPCLVHLRSVTFDCPTPIPRALVEAIHACKSSVRLHLLDWTRKAPQLDASDADEAVLVGSPALRSLHAFHPVYRHGMEDLRWPAFLRLVRSAPDLQSVRYEPLVLEQYAGIYAHEHWAAKYNTFFSEDYPKRDIREIYVDGEDALTMLLEYVNLDRIESLGLLRIDEFWDGGIGASLSALKHVELLFEPLEYAGFDTVEHKIEHVKANVDIFFAQVPPLESLTIYGPRDALFDLSPVLSRHGPTLRKLHIHQHEPYPEMTGYPPRRVLTLAEVAAIRAACPLLEDLGIDIDQDSEAPAQYLDAVCEILARPPRLRRATLNLDLGLHLYSALGEHSARTLPEEQWPEDLTSIHSRLKRYAEFNNSQACDIWRAVAAKGTRLKELIIREGEPDQVKWPSGEHHGFYWILEMKLSHRYRVTPCERDDMQDEVEVKQTATGWIERQYTVRDRARGSAVRAPVL
ncbi:hypothetical protein GGG16DRAFT_118846 [Schizophyllum commune]